jgi:hypothetical protein
VYLALYARRAWVIFDHPYNAEYALAASGECAMSEPHRTASSGAVPRPGWRSASRLVA